MIPPRLFRIFENFSGCILRLLMVVLGLAFLDGLEASPIQGAVQPKAGNAMALVAKGQAKMLVIRVDFSDMPGEPVSYSKAKDICDNQVDPFLKRCSLGKFGLETTVTNKTYRLPGTVESYKVRRGRNTLHQDALAAAGADYDMNSYGVLLVAFSLIEDNSIWCGDGYSFAGLSELGGNKIWINGAANFTRTVIAHELGHSLGLGHAQSIIVNDWPVSAESAFPYGDLADTMGSGAGSYNVFMLSQLGWLSSEYMKVVTEPKVPIRIWLQDDGLEPGNLVAFKIPGAAQTNYWCQARSTLEAGVCAQLFISWPSGDSAVVGIPSQKGVSQYLRAGEYFVDIDMGVTVQVSGVGESSGRRYVDCLVEGAGQDLSKMPRIVSPPRILKSMELLELSVGIAGNPTEIVWQKRNFGSVAWEDYSGVVAVNTANESRVSLVRAPFIEAVRCRLKNSHGSVLSNPVIVLSGPPLDSFSKTVSCGQQRYLLTVNINGPWAVDCSDSWVSCLPRSGDGPAIVTVTVASNTSEQRRNSTLRIASGQHLLVQDGSAEARRKDLIYRGDLSVGNSIRTSDIPVKLGDGFSKMTSPGIFEKADGTRWAVARRLMRAITTDWALPDLSKSDDSFSMGRLIRVPDDIVSYAYDMNGGGYLFIKRDGSVWSVDRTVGKAVKVGDKGVSVSCGWSVASYLDSSGQLWSFGKNYFGEVGTGNSIPVAVPTKVAEKVAQVSACTHTQWFVSAGGGLNGYGKRCFMEMGMLPGFDNGVAKVASSGVHLIVLKSDGTAWGGGRNMEGALGLGTWMNEASPQYIRNGVKDVSVWLGSSYFLLNDGSLQSCGDNTLGQLGLQVPHNNNHLVTVATQVTALFENIFLKADGSLWVTGGMLSDPVLPKVTASSTPATLAQGVSQVSIFGDRVWRLDSDGSLYCSGCYDASQAIFRQGDWRLIDTDVASIESVFIAAIYKTKSGRLKWSDGYGTNVLSAEAVFASGYGSSSPNLIITKDGRLWRDGVKIADGALSAYATDITGDFILWVDSNRSLYQQDRAGVNALVAKNCQRLSFGGTSTLYYLTEDGLLMEYSPEYQQSRPLASSVESFSESGGSLLFKTMDGFLWGMKHSESFQFGISGTAMVNPICVGKDMAGFSVGQFCAAFIGDARDCDPVGISRFVMQPRAYRRISNTGPIVEFSVRAGLSKDTTIASCHWEYKTSTATQWSKVVNNSLFAYENDYRYNGVRTSNLIVITQDAKYNDTRFRCIIDTSAGELVSDEVVLKLPVSLVLTTPPSSIQTGLGGAVVLTAAAVGEGSVSYQWYKIIPGVPGVSGEYAQPISGANSANFQIPKVSLADAGEYVLAVTDSVGTVLSNKVAITVVTVPKIDRFPVAENHYYSGGALSISPQASGGSLQYQWRKNGTPISGATSASLAFDYLCTQDSASYDVLISNGAGSVLSPVFTLSVIDRTRLVNLSTRSVVGLEFDSQVAGFVLSGKKPQKMLLRSVGPSLVDFGVKGVLGDPKLELMNQAGLSLVVNDNWCSDAAKSEEISSVGGGLGAFALKKNSTDAAAVVTLDPGLYTVTVSPKDLQSGVGIVELYDGDVSAETHLVNISTRSLVGADYRMQVAGFIISGEGTKRLLIRGVGPTLKSKFGITKALSRLRLELLDSAGKLLYSNTDWESTVANAAAISKLGGSLGAFEFSSGLKDAALIVALPQGAYTVQVVNLDTTEGIALIEIYDAN